MIMQNMDNKDNFGNRVTDVVEKDNFLIDNYFKMSQIIDKVTNIMELIEGAVYEIGTNVGKL